MARRQAFPSAAIAVLALISTASGQLFTPELRNVDVSSSDEGCVHYHATLQSLPCDGAKAGCNMH